MMAGKSAGLPGTPMLTDASRPLAAVAEPRILCATDLSPHSRKVVARAVVMSSQLDSKLMVLHVVSAEQEGHAFACGRIQQQWKAIQPPLRHEPATRLETGDYLPVIASIADEIRTDLIVLDSRPWKPLLSPIATTAGELAAQVRRPVLIVKRGSQAPYRSVLIAAEQSAAFDQSLRMLSSWRVLESESVAIIHGFESCWASMSRVWPVITFACCSCSRAPCVRSRGRSAGWRPISS
jgi:nucleotide-binding universal stress UspA family protein